MYLVGIMSMLILVTFSIIYNYDCFVPPVLAQQETAPVANAGADQIVHANDIITLNGSKSFDPDGDTIINYHWEGPPFSMLFVTPGSPAYFANGKTVQVQIPNVLAPTDFAFSLIVGDGKYNSNPADIVVIHALPLNQ